MNAESGLSKLPTEKRIRWRVSELTPQDGWACSLGGYTGAGDWVMNCVTIHKLAPGSSKYTQMRISRPLLRWTSPIP